MIPDNVFLNNIKEIGEEEFRSAYFVMSQERQQLCDSFRNEDDRKRCIAADMLVRKILKKYYNYNEKDIIFCRDSNGKPFLADCDIQFNVSHCENYVAAAFSYQQIGIDIERIRPVNLAVMKRVCTMDEIAYILGKETEIRKRETDLNVLKRFFEVWTFKESFVKSSGEGISDNMKTIDFFTSKKKMFYFEDYVGCVVE